MAGGLSSHAAGGNFWQGFGTGMTVSGLNHLMHHDPPYVYKGKRYKSEAELYGAILMDEFSNQFGITDIVAFAAAMDNFGFFE